MRRTHRRAAAVAAVLGAVALAVRDERPVRRPRRHEQDRPCRRRLCSTGT